MKRVVKIWVVKHVNGESVFADRGGGSGDRRDDCIVREDNICRRVWRGRERGRGRDIRESIKVVAGATVESRER